RLLAAPLFPYTTLFRSSAWGTQERILVCMTPRANAAKMLASGRRNADRFHGELRAIYVMQENLTPEDRMALERNVTLAQAQQAQDRKSTRLNSSHEWIS